MRSQDDLSRSIFERHSKAILFLFVPITTLFLFLLLEFGFRAAVLVKKGKTENFSSVKGDDQLGWVLNDQMDLRKLKNYCGDEVVKQQQSDEFIIKFPKVKQGAYSVLFVGDSFTQAGAVSTGEAFYDVFERLGNDRISVFAAGVGGFGNLQEYLLLKESYNRIQPDFVFWQLCGNDPSDNVFSLDNSSFYNNQRPRPYLNLENNSIEMKNPGLWLFDQSQLFNYLFGKMLILDNEFELGILSFLNRARALDPSTHKEESHKGLRVLDNVLSRAMADFPETVFVGFSVDSKFEQEFKRIFEQNNAVYIDEFYAPINSVDDTDCMPLDFHWNSKGHKIAGGRLYDFWSSRWVDSDRLTLGK